MRPCAVPVADVRPSGNEPPRESHVDRAPIASHPRLLVTLRNPWIVCVPLTNDVARQASRHVNAETTLFRNSLSYLPKQDT